MTNMSYCRFENTLLNLTDCYDHLDDDLSPEEEEAKKKLITICCLIAKDSIGTCSPTNWMPLSPPPKETQ